jgi:hypothetical protein
MWPWPLGAAAVVATLPATMLPVPTSGSKDCASTGEDKPIAVAAAMSASFDFMIIVFLLVWNKQEHHASLSMFGD